MKPLWIGLLVSLFLNALAMAEDTSSKGGKRTIVQFDGDQIDGDLQRPDGDLVSSRPALELPSLVQPPSSFSRASRRDLLEAADRLVKKH